MAAEQPPLLLRDMRYVSRNDPPKEGEPPESPQRRRLRKLLDEQTPRFYAMLRDEETAWSQTRKERKAARLKGKTGEGADEGTKKALEAADEVLSRLAQKHKGGS